MKDILIYPVGSTPACKFAATQLKQCGIALTDHPMPEITHLLLDVPGFTADGALRGGGEVHNLLSMLPPDITIIGGKLTHPALSGYRTLDLLKDADYLAINAAITADCALRVAGPLLQTTFAQTPVLVIGWGRIGKCLERLLRAIGCPVTVAARKAEDRAMIRALGSHSIPIEEIPKQLKNTRLLYNTAPYPILSAEMLAPWKDCVKIDLASTPGLSGDGVVTAKGLPGIHAPESSGLLIADTILKLI